MSEQQVDCLWCKTAMETGYVQDKSRHLCYQTQWLSGVPEKQIVWGVNCGIKERKDGISMIAWRCPKCGAVELFAPPPAAAPAAKTG